ncbi:MAG: hypothetical protein AUJ01_09690 [Acidobacteria bacterium 13_1_40CM_3_65_5]|nr:MAG: hypothetical protein AUJ01_09690 [Acidobacteria bacterium 13_1_40CM_3_65_5]
MTTASAWSPLRRPLFRGLWIADVVSNIGTWMHDSAAAWLMTLLAPSPLMVSLVQVATTLPLFLLALPAGALADVLDRRRILLVAQVWLFLVTTLLGVLALAGVLQPWMLLVITLAIGGGSAIDLPSWQAIIPETVPRDELPAAVGLGSVAINIARALGPAIAGVLIVVGGPGPVFLINALSVLGVFFVLWRWKRGSIRASLPAERLVSAMRSGMRYVRYAPALRTVVIRTATFVGSASALWALLPLVVKVTLGRGPVSYGALVGSLGLGGLIGASLLPTWRKRWSTDTITAVATAAFALGALLWGVIANQAGTRWTLTVAGSALFLGLTLIPRFRLAAAEAADLEHSQNWPDPVVAENLDAEAGPVLVTVEYIVEPERRATFVAAMRSELAPIRRRDGAVFWELFVDSADPRRCVECWLVESWAEHLRQHARTTKSDREVEDRIRVLTVGRERTTHYVALSSATESTQ